MWEIGLSMFEVRLGIPEIVIRCAMFGSLLWDFRCLLILAVRVWIADVQMSNWKAGTLLFDVRLWNFDLGLGTSAFEFRLADFPVSN